ncbi:Uncharacterised protein [Mycobacteroides abscessus]|nr:Uncharacterised protein [Mycobacteroides abscessus]
MKTTSPPTDAPDASCMPPPAVVSPRRRRTMRAWSEPNAVPHVATAVVTPDRCAAMTSVYPSTTTTRFCFAISRLARSMP